MAALTGQSIADSYEQLLHVDRDGGGNTSNLVSIKDGDNGTTFCASMSDASTAKSIFSISGTHANGTALYIDNSATDGDVAVEWQLSGATTWLMGIEDNDSGSLKICHDTTMGTDERLSFLTASTVVNEDSGDIDFRVESNDLTHMLFVDAGNNNIGIGTSAPDVRYKQKMDIASTTDEGGTVLGGLALSLYSATTTHGVLLDLKKSRNTTPGGHTTVVDDELIGQIQYRGSDGTTFESVAGIAAYIDGSVTGSAMPGRLVFQTTPASNTLADRMTILSSGEVGIGTSVPDVRYNQKMEIATSSGESGTPLGGLALSLYSTTDTHGVLLDLKKSANATLGNISTLVVANELIGQIQWRGSDGTAFESVAGIKAEMDGTPAEDDMPGRLVFQTTPNSSTTLATRMTIDNDGHTTPGADNAQDFGASATAWKDVYYEGSLTDTSDSRFKKDIVDADLGLSFINALRPVKFKKKFDLDSDASRYGIIAQEVITVLQSLDKENDYKGIKTENPDRYGADYIQFIAPMMKAIQELSAKVTALENA